MNFIIRNVIIFKYINCVLMHFNRIPYFPARSRTINILMKMFINRPHFVLISKVIHETRYASNIFSR